TDERADGGRADPLAPELGRHGDSGETEGDALGQVEAEERDETAATRREQVGQAHVPPRLAGAAPAVKPRASEVIQADGNRRPRGDRTPARLPDAGSAKARDMGCPSGTTGAWGAAADNGVGVIRNLRTTLRGVTAPRTGSGDRAASRPVVNSRH